MTENYSLIIKTVNYTDTGRYICFVSNQHGILIDNYTDVTVIDSAVRTEQSMAVQKGEVGVVPCQVNIRSRRVSWVRGANDTLVSMDLSRSVGERSGPGYEEGLFNITNEYSLLINDVKTLHEDSYFCEVTDFDTDHLFRNVSRLNVFSFPLEPFPSIEECPREQQDLSSCTLSIASETTLTCEVREYYPVIDLFFTHGTLRVDSLETRVWNNSDGTRNKRITIATNDPSETVYECVAKGLVGKAESRSMTIHLLQNVQQTRVAVAVVVPAILVSTIIVIAVCVMQRRKRHLKQKYGKVPMAPNDPKEKQRDLISYIELWKLVKYAREQNLSDKLGKVLDKPIQDEESSKTFRTDEDFYQDFCRWKAGYIGTCQRKDFFDACRNAGLESIIHKLQKYSDSTRAVTVDDLEHTLWHIEINSIIGLLEDLGATPEHLEVLKHKDKREVVEGAIYILKHWRDVNSSGNQDVMLSLALETIKYTPSNKDFFRIPYCRKHGLDGNAIQEFLLPQITSRHCTELIDAMTDIRKENPIKFKLYGSKNRDVWIDNIIRENRTALFDSHQMIEDWWAEQNCSHYEKRCRLHRAVNVLKERIDDLDDLIDEEKRLKFMCRWRDGIIKLKQEEKSKELSTALRSIGFDGLLSPLKSKLIYKAELVDMALDLIMEDIRPFAYSLEIERTKLTSYRQKFRASHLDLGTIRLVLELFNMIDSVEIGHMRPDVCSIIDKAGYQNVSNRFTFASEPSYGELFAIAAAVHLDDKHKECADTPESSEDSTQAKESTNETVHAGHVSSSNDGEKAEEFHTGHQKTPRSDATLASINVEESQNDDDDGEVINTVGSGNRLKPKGDIRNEISNPDKSNTDGYRQRVSDLTKMLKLTDVDIPDSNMTSLLTPLKIWKERVCPGLIDHHIVLAEGLQKINKPHLVAGVINGKYHGKETNVEFIKDMVNKMDEAKRMSLRSLLGIKEEKQGKIMSSDEMSRRICQWVANPIKNRVTNLLSFKAKRHRDFNDKLVDNGFLDLAREIMNIEQVL